MADAISEPNLAPPASNVVFDITPPASDVIQPTPEEISAYEKVAGPPPAPAFNPIAELSAEELANLAVKDKSFDIASAFRSSADLHADPAIVQKSADALNLIKQRGFKLEDLPSVSEAGTAVLHTAKGFGKQLWNYANAAGGIVQTAIADAVGAAGFSAASGAEVNRRLAGNIAGTEEAVTGLAQMAAQGVGKAGRALGVTKSHAEKTPEERVADLFADVGKAEVQQQRLAGQGPFSQAVTAGTSAKADLNPEDVATLAAGDPFSFYLFGAAGKLAHAAVPLAARTAITAGTEAATQAAGRAAQVVGGKVVQGVGKAVGGTAGLVEKTAPVVAPIAGAVKGGALYGPAGIAGGFIAGERAGKILASGARRVGGVADNLAELGRDIASSAPVKSAYAQAGRDFLQALPGATFETAKGVGLDLGLAAATAETPPETQGAIGFGTALSGAQGALRVGGRVISGQLIAPREYGISAPQASSGHFPAFDAVHNEAFKSASPGIKARLNALRKFTSGAAGTDVFFAPDAARLAEALQASGLSAEQAQAFSQHQGFFSANMPDATGTPRKVVIVTNPDAAPHESFHAIQDVLGEQGNQAVDQIVRESYADQWDKQGTDYANRMTGGDIGNRTWQEAILDTTGKGMGEAKEKVFQQIYNSIEGQTGAAPSRALVESLAKEAYGRIMDDAVAKNPQVPPDQIALQAWREILSPEEAARAADTYIARELAAENFDAIFKHAGPSLAEPNSLPAKLARVAGRVMSALGMDTTGGRVAELGKTTLRAPVIEAVRKVGQGRLPEIEVFLSGKTATIKKAPVGTPAEEARAIADEAPELPTERGTMSQREMLGNVAESIAAREGVKINYLSAPGEPAAATTSNRQARRDIIEAFRDMPAAARALWEKTFFPERVRKTQGGKYQVFGWAPEVFAANAHKMASFLVSHPELSPYAIDAATKSFTPEAWQELYRDTQTFVQNQKAGQTGSGEPLVVPKSMTDRGFTAPASRAADAVALDQNKADFINMLFNAKLPETPRIQKGKTPLNLAGQEISAATIPGRVEVPVRPRGEYAGAEAERQGIVGREVAEVNPLRNAIEAAALADKKPMPSLIEANQMLNLENIKELERAPEQPEFRANTLTLQAGFAPAMEKALRDLPPVLKGAVRLYHGEGGPQGGGTGGAFFTTTPEKAATYGPRISYVDVPAESAKAAREAARKIGEGGDTSILTREDIIRSKEISAEVPIVTYDLDASFVPKDAMEKLKNLPDAEWQEEMTNFKGKYGGNLTGWAYEIGSQAKTADDLQAFRSTSEAINIATTAAMKAGDYGKAMNLSVRSQAAHEAYQAATGETFEGKVAGTAKFIRERYDPAFEYPMPAGDTKAGEPPLPANFAPKPKEDLKFKGGKTGFTKAWILPDGKAVQLGGTWHHQWLAENPDVTKKFDLTVPPFEGTDVDGVREAALNKGFSRVVLNRNTGGLIIEAREKDWPKQKIAVERMVEKNLDDIDTMKVTLFDDIGTSVIDSASKALFNFDTNKEKMANLPFISVGEIKPGHKLTSGPEFFEPPQGQFAPAKFEDDGFAAVLKKIRSGQEAGQTFNTDGTVWSAGDAKVDLVPLASVNVPQGKLTPEAFREALAPYADLLDEPTIKAGVFSFSQGGEPIVSIDINAVVPQEFRKNSVAFAKGNDQVAMWDAVKNENVETGGKGNTRLTKTNEIIDALDALTTGEPVDIAEIKRQYAETAGRAEEQGALFAGGKEYVGNRAVADMTKAQLAEAFPEVVIPRRRTDPIPSEITQSPLFKQAGSESQAVDAFARRLVEFSKEYQNDPAFQAGAKWYSEFVPKLKKEFGADAQVMAELLAATSPQTAVGVNFAYAFDALQSLKSGRFDKTITKFKQGLDMMDNGKWLAWYNKENAAGNIPKPPAQPTLPAFLEAWIAKYDLKPRQSNGALYGTHSIPVLQVFARKWLTESRGPKTLNFVKNLVGEGHEATIDLWADRTMRRVGYSGFRNRWRIMPGNVQGVSAPDFAFAQKAFRKAAEELKMEPDALQGALWFAEKKLWHDKGWGRLDLGDFQAELAKVPMMKAGYKQRVETSKKKATEKTVETPDLFTVEPRYKK